MKLQKETRLRNGSSHGRWYDDACGMAFSMELLGERWSMLIVREMLLGPRRFSGLRASLPGISAKTLTERLATLEAAGLVTRSQLPPPVSAQVYELTDWGRRAEPAILELCRWGAMSPMHDPSLPISATALLLSMKTMFRPERAQGVDLVAGLCISGENYHAQISAGAIGVARGMRLNTDFTFDLLQAGWLLGLIYGKRPIDQMEGEGLAITGSRELALRFADCFALPDRIGGHTGGIIPA